MNINHKIEESSLKESIRVLIVEDEEKLLTYLKGILNEEEFSTSSCSSYFELETLIEIPMSRFDVIILDRLLQGKDSGTLLSKIKYCFPDAKILILSAINTPSEKALLLDSGADDYLAKPFDGEELVARVRALLRRNYHSIKLGDVSLNSISRTMTINQNEISLTNKEFDLLKTLSQAPGKIFNKSFLNSQVWEVSSNVDSNAVEATITKLRRKLVEAGSSVSIRNIRNRGYWIEE